MKNIQELSSFKSLDDRIWKTKHTRYLASARLKNKNTYSQYTICVLSIYVLALSLGPKYGYFTSITGDKINFVNILLSVAIIAISLLESNSNYQLQAERLYTCANELGGMLQKLKCLADFMDENAAVAEIQKLSTEYEQLLQRYKENHEGYDYDLFCALNAKHFKINWFKGLYFKIKYYACAYSLYFVLIVTPPWLILTYISYN